MKNIIITLFAVMLLTITVLAQANDTERYEKVIKKFAECYNKGDYKKMEADYSEEMLKDFSLDKSKPLFDNIKATFGSIQKFDIPVFPVKNQAIFTTYFEKGILDIILALNDKNKIIGLMFMEHPKTLPTLDRNETFLYLPFKGRWTVAWGGDTKEQNIHNDNQNQKFAFDFVITDDKGLTYKDLGARNEDYYALSLIHI